MDRSSDSDEDLNRFGVEETEFIANPLALISADADLDQVLKASSIGETIQLLCPALLPDANQPRMKYRKRGSLTPAQKIQLTRDQNKENARRTRKRRRLFDCFLTSAIVCLEAIVKPKVLVEATEKSSTSSNRDETGSQSPKIQNPNSVALNQKIQLIKSFVAMRCSKSPFSEPLQSICSENILFAISYPIYRKLNELATMRGMFFECHGISSIADDTEKRNAFLSTILYQINWVLEGEIKNEDILTVDGNTIDFKYTLHVYEDKSPSHSNGTTEPLPSSSKETKSEIKSHHSNQSRELISTLYLCRIIINPTTGKIDFISEQFNTQEFMTRARYLVLTSRQQQFSNQNMMNQTLNSQPNFINRMEIVKKFIAMRMSPNPSQEKWGSVCTFNSTHSLNSPYFKKPESNINLEGAKEYLYKGIEELIRTTEERSRLISSMVSGYLSGTGTDCRGYSWSVDINLYPNSIQYCWKTATLKLKYEGVLYAIPPAIRSTPLNGSSHATVSPYHVPSDRSKWIVVARSIWTSEFHHNEDHVITSSKEVRLDNDKNGSDGNLTGKDSVDDDEDLSRSPSSTCMSFPSMKSPPSTSLPTTMPFPTMPEGYSMAFGDKPAYSCMDMNPMMGSVPYMNNSQFGPYGPPYMQNPVPMPGFPIPQMINQGIFTPRQLPFMHPYYAPGPRYIATNDPMAYVSSSHPHPSSHASHMMGHLQMASPMQYQMSYGNMNPNMATNQNNSTNK